MPKGKMYNKQNVGIGASKTPMGIMGSQGKPASLPKDQHMSRPTKDISFEQGTAPRKASGRGNAPNHGMKKDY